MAIEAARRYVPLDILTLFCEDTTLAATGYIQEDSADKVIDLGAGRTDADWVIDHMALEVATGNETYTHRLLASNTEDFSGDKVILRTVELGAGTALSAIASPVSRYVAPFTNAFGSVEYRYLKHHVTIAGTIATGATFTSWLSDARY